MTDREAIAKAKKELDMANYFAETSSHAGLRTVHRNRADWLCRVLGLARKALYIEENQKQPQTNADRSQAMSCEEKAREFVFFCPTDAVFRGEDTYGKPHYIGLDGKYYSTSEEVIDANLKWLKQPAEVMGDGCG